MSGELPSISLKVTIISANIEQIYHLISSKLSTDGDDSVCDITIDSYDGYRMYLINSDGAAIYELDELRISKPCIVIAYRAICEGFHKEISLDKILDKYKINHFL